MRVLITAIGTSGDVNPFIAVGIALKERGHEVVLLVNPYFEGQVRGAGLEYLPLGEPIDLRLIAKMPDLMHARKGLKLTLDKLIVPNMPIILDAIGMEVRDRRPDIVLSHHTCPGSRWACQRHDVPFAGAVLTPLLWPSSKDPCVFMSWEPENPPEWYSRWRNRAARWMLRGVIDRRFNRVRLDYGMSRGRDLFYAEVLGGVVNLGLWSRHFRGAMPDDPPNGRICGFPWFDRHKDLEHPEDELEKFLTGGDPPIIFTLGTAAVHTAGDFYASAAKACADLGRRGLLLTRHTEYGPSSLPRGVGAFTYAPFSTVLPRGCATVHHGGVGTTAQAMRAGRPTVIVPFSHDQFDNAARAKRLGVSATLRRKKATARSLSEALRTVLDDPAVAARATSLGEALSQEDGAVTAAIALEEVVSTGSAQSVQVECA